MSSGITIAGGRETGGALRPVKAPPLRPQNRQLAVLAVLLVVAIPLPLVLPPAMGAVAVRILIFLLMAIGWNVMSGFGGMFTLICRFDNERQKLSSALKSPPPTSPL